MSTPSACMPERASDPIIDGCEIPCGCWELNFKTFGRTASALNH